MAYPSPTTINATKGWGEILTYINVVTNNWISTLLLLAIFVIILIAQLKARDDFLGGLAISSYVTFILATLLWVIGFVNPVIYGVVIGVTVLATAGLFIGKD